MLPRLCFLFLLGFGFSFTTHAAPTAARTIFERLTGVPMRFDDPRLGRLEQLGAAGDLRGVARMATDDPLFLDVTVKGFAAVMSNRALTPFVPLNDFTALVAGVTRDLADSRTMLYGDFRYELAPSSVAVSRANNTHFEQGESAGASLASLRRVEPQWSDVPGAGLLTTRAWGQAHMEAGTNRRALQYAMQEFLCRPIETWKDVSIPDDRIRQDVSRAPSGNAQEFQSNCRGCHGPMDALSGAFAHYEFRSATKLLAYLPARVAAKYTQNSNVFPYGYPTYDDSWINLLADNESFGWHGPQEGQGVASLGRLLAHSDAFAACMSRRVFRAVCKRDLNLVADGDLLRALTAEFATSGYQLRALFEASAVSSQCLGERS